MSANDPKAIALKRFADSSVTAVDVIGRCATDPPRIVAGLTDAIRERAPAGSTVAELGFGSGWLLQELVDELNNVSVVGLDLSMHQVRQLRKLIPEASVVVGDMERLPYRDGQFDVITTSWTLYFMRDIRAAIAEIVRCLTPGGRLVVGVSASDHELEANKLVAAAGTRALGRELEEPDIGRRFDLETGKPYLDERFASVEVRRWPGEMELRDMSDVMALWPKWEPAMLSDGDSELVRGEFEALARQHIERDGSLEIRRRDGGFVCDLSP